MDELREDYVRDWLRCWNNYLEASHKLALVKCSGEENCTCPMQRFNCMNDIVKWRLRSIQIANLMANLQLGSLPALPSAEQELLDMGGKIDQFKNSGKSYDEAKQEFHKQLGDVMRRVFVQRGWMTA